MEQGSFYHIYNRGNNKQPIFFEKKNYQHFLKRFDKYLSAFVDVYAYCLMPNYFHFLIMVKEFLETQDYRSFKNPASQIAPAKTTVVSPETGVHQDYRSFKNPASQIVPAKTTVVSIEKAFKTFFMAYAKGINNVYNRTGALFQQKFRKKEITDDGYFTSIIQYIHANPIAAGLCGSYEDWEFSSYNAIIGTTPTKVKREEVIEWFGSKEIFIKVHQERELEREQIRRFLFD